MTLTREQKFQRGNVWRYGLIATILTGVIIIDEQQSQSAIESAILELELVVKGLDEAFCERINAMHEVRGFEVLDCKTGTVRLTSAKRAK